MRFCIFWLQFLHTNNRSLERIKDKIPKLNLKFFRGYGLTSPFSKLLRVLIKYCISNEICNLNQMQTCKPRESVQLCKVFSIGLNKFCWKTWPNKNWSRCSTSVVPTGNFFLGKSSKGGLARGVVEYGVPSQDRFSKIF